MASGRRAAERLVNGETNIDFGLAWICVGLIAGAPLALGFVRAAWLGGYASLERRLLRLAHVACVMLGALNVVFGMLACDMPAQDVPGPVVERSLIAGAVLMPLVLVASVRFRRALWALPVPFTLFTGGAVALFCSRMT